MDLIRDILRYIENDETGNPISNIEIEGYSRAQITYHVIQLKDAGYIDANILDEMGSQLEMPYMVLNLTWNGHEFLDASRDETIWIQAKSKLSEVAGSAPINVVTSILTALIQVKLGLSP